ncbi:hypothetical protein A7K93_00180 [Candidatus Methylacidiphilum fumarolicum]|uniref:UDP-N-acetyl-alpha-D-muramoyl-L-alanyl-L-glutamate epimerase n=3 Tax=Candidatus Methylacidiphilum fumarolicum TaxID=591154 RepID=I0K0Y8_METFB|nr:hypothetical protein [Candidatus Methylacidiphilum fumarolicum]MBW6413973.1 hypothetical protein [Candidatus Methylacidiphilum fumarolicum]TFE70515.1 hypothetical protein A7K73_03565 [Candidatus Methylacidiphilum fumarolicum]TFE74767.1 hypothetical protein A7K72_03150 [Candidatus Methylacidiphilum fumarolicum]TFE76013.1 hypothetical protein A7K93_00180 [Candidatus Methylacidiphilum fumarolicum]TFE76402.1 hypothetical protein A7D33_00755 [Candidatus Methylacidiphilum fumarolicum]
MLGMEYVPTKSAERNFLQLRKLFPRFVFSRFSSEIRQKTLYVEYEFWTGKDKTEAIFFRPYLKIYGLPLEPKNNLGQYLDAFLFHIGMIELISYWKATCSPHILIETAFLSLEQLNWWSKLYWKGLGEFFFQNGIEKAADELMQIECRSQRQFPAVEFPFLEGNVLPIGGGKDSFLTLEWLKEQKEKNLCFLLNPVQSQWDTLEYFGYPQNQIVVVERKIDDQLLELNKKGFLNGHTPFSALLAFIGVLLMAIHKRKYFITSHESSASEPTIPSKGINHQYSKSYEFEKDFQNYLTDFLCPSFCYFSFLRPLNEIQIARHVSAIPKSVRIFQSCNRNRSSGGWCGHCPKCLFVFLILRPFVPQKELEVIFGSDLLENESLFGLLLSLCGEGTHRPFECVGSEEETKAAASLLWYQARKSKEHPPLLIRKLIESYPEFLLTMETLQALYDQTDREHRLPQKFLSILNEKCKIKVLFND